MAAICDPNPVPAREDLPLGSLRLEERSNPVIIAAVAVRGLVIGGAPVLFQTAEARLAGDATDVAQAMFVTIWNAGVAGGGIIGGCCSRLQALWHSLMRCFCCRAARCLWYEFRAAGFHSRY